MNTHIVKPGEDNLDKIAAQYGLTGGDLLLKKCSKCGLIKSKLDFHRDKHGKEGLHSFCKSCVKEKDRIYHSSFGYKEKKNEFQRSILSRKYQNKYRKLSKYKNYIRIKKNNNIEFKLNCNMSSYLYSVLRNKKDRRKWTELVGYTIKELMIHLEKQFEPWMNWNNYGKWHVDHIKPKSLFHYTSPEDKEFKECWSLSNLQPLEAHENLVKNNKSI